MAQEQQELKALGNIVPMMSLNKHINGVPNYSLHEAINMRMSDDRMAIQNIEKINSHETIMNFLNSIYGSNVYKELYYNNEKIINKIQFANIIISNVEFTYHHYDEQDIYNGIIDAYNDIDFSYTSINELVSKINSINNYMHTELEQIDEINIKSFIELCDIVISNSSFEILYILPCNNELILFVWNKNLARIIDYNNGSKCVELIRYNEKTNEINRVYSALTYYGGKYIGDYTYNYDNYLIITFCEYFDKETNLKDNAVKTITLGNNGTNDYNTLNCDEKLFYNEPELKIPNIVEIYKTSGKGYFGWYFFYIRYKINKYDYTKWTYIGYPILLEYKNTARIFKNLNIKNTVDQYNKNTITLDNTNFLDQTVGIKMIFDSGIIYNKYQLGVIIINLDDVKKFRTDDLIVSASLDYKFDINNLIEEDIDTNSNYNHYNVKNLISYKNRIYLANYREENQLKNYNTNNIKLSLLNIGSSISYQNSYRIGNITVYHDRLFSGNSLINPMIGNGESGREFEKITQICKISGYDYTHSSEGNPQFVNNLEVDINNIQYEIFTNQTIGQYTNAKVLKLIVTDANDNIYEILSATLRDSSPDFSPITIMSLHDDEEDDEILFRVVTQNVEYYNIYRLDFDSLRQYDADELLYYASDYDYFNLKENTYSTTLSSGEIYKFYIHFVDKFGNISKGFPIYNNRKLFYSQGDRVTEYTIFAIDSYQTSSTSLVRPVLYAVPISYTIKDVDDLISLPTSSFIKVTSITNDIDYDLFDGTVVTAYELSTKLSAFDKSLHIYDIGDERGFLNEQFGLYINNKGERLFYVPYMNNNDNYGLSIENITIPKGYVGYYISVKKPFIRQKFVGIRKGAYYSDDINILLEKPSFSFFKSFKLATENELMRLNKEYRANESSPLNIIYFSAYDGTNTQYAKNLRYAGDPSKDRIDRSTVLGESVSITEDAYAGVGVDTNNNIYMTKGDELFVIGGFKNFNENNIYLALPGHDFYTSAIIYDERIGFRYDTAENEATSKPDVYEIIQKSNKYISRVINKEPYISYNGNGEATTYVIPINTLDLFKNKIADRFSLDFNILEEFDEERQYVSVFNNNILFSNVISDESIKENWRKFNIEDYKLISENKGEIVKLFVLGDYMFIHCTQAIYLLQFKDYLATTEESLQITQSSIKDISYKELLPTDKGYAGLQDKDAAIIGSFGYIFYENDTHRILRLDNNQLVYIDYPIYQWLQKYKPYEVRFANDVERYNLLIQFKYYINNVEKVLILLYDYLINSFVSILDSNIYGFTQAFNTKNKLYLLCNNNSQSIIKSFKHYSFNKEIFNVLNKENNYIQLTNKLSFVYNINYNSIKYLESIMFKGFKYIKSEDPTINESIDFTNDPIETIRIPFCGDYIRIYNENVDTGWINIKEAQDKNTYNNREHYELPYYYLGNWMMNMFRNVKDRKNDINYSKFDKQDYTEADDRARLYGNYFIVEFGFNINDSKYTNEESDKFEFQSIEINVSQQFLQQ